jgi:hypothetical protein
VGCDAVTSIILIKLEYGGFVVKEHNFINAYQPLLFAGGLDECLDFMGKWLKKEKE